MRRGIFYILGFVLLVAANAWAAPRLGLDEAIRLYDSAKFEQARIGFESILADPSTGKVDQDLARLYLAATFLAANDKTSARAHLRAMLKDKPSSYVIDAVAFPPELIALADAVRAELEAERPKPVVAAAAPPTEVTRPARSTGFLIPMGLGVAAAVAGGVLTFLALDRNSMLLAANTGAPLRNGVQLREDGKLFQTAGLIAFGVGGGLFAIGLAVALVSGGTEPSTHAMISIGPGGAVVGFQGVLP